MRLLLAAALVGLLLSAAGARAQIAGQDDPGFVLALELWLDDDEETALPELAALARRGNRAAQILLALIDVTPRVQGPWLAALPREERIALMRMPGGLSGRSWMQAAAEDVPLARLWLRRWDARDEGELDTALAFAEIGEARAARETLLTRMNRNRRGFAAIADDPLYPPDLRALIWSDWERDPGNRARIDAEIEALLPGDPQVSFHLARPTTIAQRDAWLADSPLAAPLRAFCAATCPDAARSCARAAYGLVGADSLFASTAGTPSETLIPPETWNYSPRGLASILRFLRNKPLAAIRVVRTDRCTASAFAAESERFPPLSSLGSEASLP
jgi:hypothetical protein